ncbi:MAG: hypothetical protein ABFD25_07230 [Clostridiaceae bacterium]
MREPSRRVRHDHRLKPERAINTNCGGQAVAGLLGDDPAHGTLILAV